MGLDNFDIAPDNKGGRKKKEESEESDYKGEYWEGDAFHTEHRLPPEDYWRTMFDRHVEGDEPTGSELKEICKDTCLLPRTVKSKLVKYNICEFPEFVEEEEQKEDESSGLASLVNNAK